MTALSVMALILWPGGALGAKWARAMTTPKALRDYAVIAALLLLTFALDVVTRRDWKRFFSSNFITDLAYYAVYYGGFYTVLYSPLGKALNLAVARWLPFLRLQLLASLPPAAQVVVFIVVTDFLGYWQHRLMHASRPLWSLHQIHHSQEKMTIFTNYRFHIAEETFRRLFGFVPFVMMGSAPEVWVAADVLMSWILLMQHSANHWSYGPLDALFVSPRMHEVHHAAAAELHDHNFGMVFSFWDRLFGTLRVAETRVERFGIEPAIAEGFWPQLLMPLREWSRAARRRISRDPPPELADPRVA